MPKTKAILIDITKCIGCLSCEQACKQLHGFPMETEPKLSPTALTVVEEHGDRFVRRHVHELPGSGLRFGVPGGCAAENRLGPGDLRSVQVHRVPLLHRRLPVQRAALRMVEAGSIREEMRYVLLAASQRTASSLRGSLPGAGLHLGLARRDSRGGPRGGCCSIRNT